MFFHAFSRRGFTGVARQPNTLAVCKHESEFTHLATIHE